jgi:hypothetical protein
MNARCELRRRLSSGQIMCPIDNLKKCIRGQAHLARDGLAAAREVVANRGDLSPAPLEPAVAISQKTSRLRWFCRIGRIRMNSCNRAFSVGALVVNPAIFCVGVSDCAGFRLRSRALPRPAWQRCRHPQSRRSMPRMLAAIAVKGCNGRSSDRRRAPSCWECRPAGSAGGASCEGRICRNVDRPIERNERQRAGT